MTVLMVFIVGVPAQKGGELASREIEGEAAQREHVLPGTAKTLGACAVTRLPGHKLLIAI